MLLNEHISSKEMKAIELNSQYLGVCKLLLMENAGNGIAQYVKNHYPEKKNIVIACGLGGNGGDGFVAARHLASEGYQIEVLLLGRGEHIHSPESEINYKSLKTMTETVKIIEIRDSADIPPLKSDIIIDALIGIGIQGPLRSPYKQMVEKINSSKAIKISVDIPSGMNADTGETYNNSVNPDYLLTFHKRKTGIKKLTSIIIPIGIPSEATTQTGPGDVFQVNKPRDQDSHKGKFGKLLVIGGSENYSGAPALVGMAAYATGVDICHIAAPESAASIIASYSPSLITTKLKGALLSGKNVKKIEALIERFDAVAIGPGLGDHDETMEAVRQILDKVTKPLVIDADALKALVDYDKKLPSNIVLTPHRGEFRILTGKTIEGNINDKETVQKQASKLGETILLKSSIDIICDGKHTRTNHTGNPGMTVGGTGDVLAGITAAYLAMGAGAFESACAAAFVSGKAGDIALKDMGYNFEAKDVVDRIPIVIRDCLEGKMVRD